MANQKYTKDFFIKLDGKILKSLEIKTGDKFRNVRIALNIEDKTNADIAILPADLKVPGLIRVVRPEEVTHVTVFESKREMIDVLTTFDLRPPSTLLEVLSDDLSSIKRRKSFDKNLTEYLGENEVKRLSAVLWMIDDPKVEKRFAQPGDMVELTQDKDS